MFSYTTIICGSVVTGTFDNLETALDCFAEECEHVDDCAKRLVNRLDFVAQDISTDNCAALAGIKVHGYQLTKPNGDTTAVLTYLVYVSDEPVSIC